MALRGSLHEFELPDIFQLIANDGKTGQLVIYNKESEAFVIFSRGMIIAAGTSVMNLQTIIFKYLMDVKRYSEKELNELLYVCQGEMRLFTQELVNKQYVSKEELYTLARMGIEDLACGLFIWEKGNYRFDSLETVDDYLIGGVSLSSDAVTMEAMRRVDEWKRMKKAIGPDTVFAPVKFNAEESRQSGAAQFSIMNPTAYLFSLIDGVTTVNTLCTTTFFTEYRVYETLLDFWHNNLIMPFKMPRMAARSALQQKKHDRFPLTASGMVAFFVVHFLALFIVGVGYFMHTTILTKKNQAQYQLKNELCAAIADSKRHSSALLYHALFGQPVSSSDQLFKSGLIESGEK